MQNRTLNTGSDINAEIEAQLTNTNDVDNVTPLVPVTFLVNRLTVDLNQEEILRNASFHFTKLICLQKCCRRDEEYLFRTGAYTLRNEAKQDLDLKYT